MKILPAFIPTSLIHAFSEHNITTGTRIAIIMIVLAVIVTAGYFLLRRKK
jgi:uncharacterized membrane protein (DUF485 family)